MFKYTKPKPSLLIFVHWLFNNKFSLSDPIKKFLRSMVEYLSIHLAFISKLIFEYVSINWFSKYLFKINILVSKFTQRSRWYLRKGYMLYTPTKLIIIKNENNTTTLISFDLIGVKTK